MKEVPVFVGRSRELATLNRLYETGTFQFPVIYGRRRVGKTTLINEFVGKKPVVFFTAVENNARINLENLSRAVALFEHPDRDPSLAPALCQPPASLRGHIRTRS